MFEYVKLKNFKSFRDVTLNLLDKHNDPKKLVLIYGENGIGKSNIVSAFFMLHQILKTMDVRDIFKMLYEEDAETVDDFLRIKKSLRLVTIESIIEEYKMVSSDEPMSLEFGFNINGKRGSYLIQMDDTQIINEKLDFIIERRRGSYFEIDASEKWINDKLFLNREVYRAVNNTTNKLWGKHSFLSIILHEIDDKARQYMLDQLSENFKLFLEFITDFSCKVEYDEEFDNEVTHFPDKIISNFEYGTIPAKDEQLLGKAEKMLTTFLKNTNPKIKKVYYKKDNDVDEGIVNYNLMFSESIAGEEREIDVSLESSGTKSIIQLLPYLLSAVNGSISIIDEFDIRIHDLLVKEIISVLNDQITGQLILTTHNTIIMEAELPNDCLYVINETEGGNKEIQCILNYDNKIGKNNNVRDQYLRGKFNGIPKIQKIDFNELLDEIGVAENSNDSQDEMEKTNRLK